MQHAKDYGLSADNVGFDPAAVVKRSRGVSKRLNDGVGFLMKKNKVDGDLGRGRHRRARQDHRAKPAAEPKRPKGALGPGRYQAKHIIIATGARPRVLPGLEPDKKLVWTYFEAMVPDRMPKSLLVVGSGAIGIEFASFYRTLGAEVTVVEVLPQILPVEDAEIAAFARKSFEKQGIKIFTGAKVTKLDKKADSVTATIDDGKGGTQTLDGRARDLGRRRRRQYRESRAGKARREDRARHHRGRRLQPHQRARHLRDRRRRRPADAGAQGRARRRHLRRGDQGAQAASDGQAHDPGLHLLHPADRLGRPYRSRPPRRKGSRSGSAAFRSSATARRSRSARTRAWSR